MRCKQVLWRNQNRRRCPKETFRDRDYCEDHFNAEWPPLSKKKMQEKFKKFLRDNPDVEITIPEE